MILLLAAVGVGVVFFATVFCVAFVRARRLAKMPTPPKPKCPSCGGEQIDIAASGLWDGINTGGGFQYGTCRGCGTRCEHRSAWADESQQVRYTDRIPTDEEWRQVVEPSAEQLRIRKLQSQWPFVSDDKNHLA